MTLMTFTSPNIQALAWLHAIPEDYLGDKSEGENVCEGLDRG